MLFCLFIFVLLLTLFSPVLFPSINLNFFIPLLIISYYRKSFISCLWLSLLCGIILDLLAAQHRLGLHAVNYCLITWILYGQKRNFFEDSLSTIPLMTLLFSVSSTAFQAVLLFVFEKGFSFSWQWVGTDLIVMPLWDALYGFVVFAIPIFCMSKGSRKSGKEYFLR